MRILYAAVGIALMAAPVVVASRYLIRKEGWETFAFMIKVIGGVLLTATVMTTGLMLLVEGALQW